MKKNITCLVFVLLIVFVLGDLAQAAILTFNPSRAEFGASPQGVSKQINLRVTATTNLQVTSVTIDPATHFSTLTGFQSAINQNFTFDLPVFLNANAPLGIKKGTLTVVAKMTSGPAAGTEITHVVLLTVNVVAAPDLSGQVLNLTVTPPAAGQTKSRVDFVLHASNTGGAASAAFSADVFLDDQLQATVSIPSIPANQINSLPVQFKTGKNGQHLLKVLLDTQNTVIESNENNNSVGPVTVQLP